MNDLAAAIDRTYPCVSDIERGANRIQLHTLLTIARVLRVPVTLLLRDQDAAL